MLTDWWIAEKARDLWASAWRLSEDRDIVDELLVHRIGAVRAFFSVALSQC
jgi:hypothetical protein